MPARYPYLSAILLCAAWSAACGEGDSDLTLVDDGGGIIHMDQGVGVPCKPAVEVADAAGLLAQLNALSWSSRGPYTSSRLPLSGDIRVKGTVSVTGDKVTAPSSCTAGVCPPRASFVIVDRNASVSCDAPDTAAWMQVCGGVTLRDTTVRFRAVVQDTHPGIYNYTPVIEVVDSCEKPCKAGEMRCKADNTCWSSYEDFCRLCLGRDKKICPCWSASGPLPEGTACHFMVSGDVGCSGTCQAGRCRYSGTPGWAGCP